MNTRVSSLMKYQPNDRLFHDFVNRNIENPGVKAVIFCLRDILCCVPFSHFISLSVLFHHMLMSLFAFLFASQLACR